MEDERLDLIERKLEAVRTKGGGQALFTQEAQNDMADLIFVVRELKAEREKDRAEIEGLQNAIMAYRESIEIIVDPNKEDQS